MIKRKYLLSVVILTKNNEESILECMESIKCADEIIVIDDNSTDKTRELAQKEGAKVFMRDLNKDFASQRNFGLSKCTYDWVLFIDSDEIVSEKLQIELQRVIEYNDKKINGYFLKREDTIWNKEIFYGDVKNCNLLRLARKNAGFWKGKVHEIWDIQGSTQNLSEPLKHYPHKNLSEFLEKLNQYSGIRAEELYEQKKKSSIFSIIVYTKMKFFYLYFIKQGFLDGTRGLIHALLMSLYSFLTRVKLWQLNEGK